MYTKRDLKLHFTVVKLLGRSVNEGDIEAGFFDFGPCPLDHLGRCVDAGLGSLCADLALRGNGECPRSAGDVEHRFPGLERRRAKHELTEPTFSHERPNPSD